MFSVGKLLTPRVKISNNVASTRPQQRNVWPFARVSGTTTPEQLAAKLQVPQQLVQDVDLHIMMLRTQMLFKRLNIKDPQEQRNFWDSVTISPGSSTLEWIWPFPPPFHTYNELPMIHKIGGKDAHH